MLVGGFQLDLADHQRLWDLVLSTRIQRASFERDTMVFGRSALAHRLGCSLRVCDEAQEEEEDGETAMRMSVWVGACE